MIEIKLSVEEYNRLFMMYLDEDCYNIFCKAQGDHIIFIYDPESDDAIASVNINTPEGKILSNYIECQLRISINNDEDIFIYETCMNPDEQYFGHCDNCKVDYCHCSYSCEKGMKQKINKLDKSINDIKFINPIPNRDYELVEEFIKWQFLIENIHKKLSDNVDDDVQNICQTARLLKNQIYTLYDKWKYTED